TVTDLSIIFTGSLGTKFIDYIQLFANNSMSIEKSSLSITASTYRYLTIEFNASSNGISKIEIFDGTNLICTDSTGWSSSTWYLFTCDLGLSGSWSGTETTLNITFSFPSVIDFSGQTLFLNMIYLYDQELGDLEGWVGHTLTFTEPEGNLKTTVTTNFGGLQISGESFSRTEFSGISFKVYTDDAQFNAQVWIRCNSPNAIFYLVNFPTGWSSYSLDFADFTETGTPTDECQLIDIEASGGEASFPSTLKLDYVFILGNTSYTDIGINSEGLSISASGSSGYDYFTMEVFSSVAIDEINVYDSDSNLVCNDGTDISSNIWSLLSCDLDLDADWTGTETQFTVYFNFTYGFNVSDYLLINMIYLYDQSLGDLEGLVATNNWHHLYVNPEGYEVSRVTTAGSASILLSGLNIDTSIFDTLKIRIKGDSNIRQFRPRWFVGETILGDWVTLNTFFQTFIIDLSESPSWSGISTGFGLMFGSEGGGGVPVLNQIMTIDYILLIKDPPTTKYLDLESFYEIGGRDLGSEDGHLYVSMDLLESGNNLYLSRDITTTINQNYYYFLALRIKATTIYSGIYQIRIEDQNYDDLSTWTTISGTGYNIIGFDLSSDSDWSVSITTIRLHIQLLSGVAHYLDVFSLDYVSINHKDSFIDAGLNYEFNEDSYLDNWYAWGSTGVDTSNGLISFTYGASISGLKTDIEMGLANFDAIEIRSKVSVISGLAGTIWFFDSSDTVITALNNKLIKSLSETTIIIPFSQSTDPNVFANVRKIAIVDIETGVTIKINFIRLVKDSLPNLNEADSYFVLENEDEFYYNIWSDNISLGQYQTNQPIPKEQDYGFHTLRYQMFNRITLSGDPTTGHYIPSTVYEFSYENYLVYSAVVNTFISSDFFLSIYYTANKPTDYIVYENSTLITSGNSDGSGQSVEWDKNLNVGLVLVGIKFTVSTNASEFLWFNTSYGNDLVILITSFSTYTNNTHVIIEYTSATTSISINITEDGLSKGSFSNSPITYAKSGDPGQHFVSVLFLKQYFTSVTFSFAYTTNNFFISNLQFYTTSTDVHLDWSAVNTGSRDYATI
ncbi:hypothetical protein LCGC14_1638930, partial [marine sediment metagenome]